MISDVHLGNNNNRAKEIIQNLDTYFDWYSNKSPFRDLQAIFIAGDLFDRLLNFSSNEVHEIILWLYRLMRFCHRNNIILRLLKGTPSHDREQSQIAMTVYQIFPEEIRKELDFKYIDTLHIEHIEKLNLRVLYVPDEWTGSADLTLKQVKELMAEQGLEQVDIAIMHGAFTYQLPYAPNSTQTHSEAEYLSLVKHYISVGHVHEFSIFDRIIAQGSFDRMNHGSEVPKGGVLITLRPDGNSYDFIENKGARIFRTVELKHKDLDRSMRQIEKEIAKVPDKSFIRIKTTKDHPVYQAFDELILRFPLINFNKITEEDEKNGYELIANAVKLDRSYTPIHFHQGNIVSLLTEEIKSKYSWNERKLSILKETLEKTNA